ncbi:MAG: phosphatidylserine decarboxylase [Sulfuricurvum sp.]
MGIQSDTFILSKRGWLTIAVTATLFLFFLMTGLHLFEFITGAVLLALLVIFRNPERNSADNEDGALISSVDGVVLSVEEVTLNDRKMVKVVVMNSLWDVSMLRAPFDGIVEGYKIRNGASLPLYNPLSETLNEKAVISFRTAKGDEFFIEHMSEQSCFPIGIELEPGQKLKEGNRYGFLAKGRTTLYLPEGSSVRVNPGNTVRAGESLLGYIAA